MKAKDTSIASLNRRDRRLNSLTYILTYAITLIVMIPFVWMVVLSFQDNQTILTNPFSLPDNINLDNYKRAFETLDFALLYKNTFIIAAVSLFIEMIITFASSYAISRLIFKRRKLRNGLYYFLIIGLAIPPFILLFPIYRITISLGLENTYLSLILPYIATSISFNTLLFTGFLKDFPTEIEEAAVIDGCNLFTLCTKVVFPVVKPVVMTIFIFNILYIWNEFPFAVTLISDPSHMTIPLAISEFKGRYNIDYGGIVSASLLFIIPQLVFYGIFQKHIIKGMTAGAVKG
ncbi:carbohydrate ABC transporter permease [Bacillus canaveralius]|uniref:Carbohydrate ABC transporter permease n=1 Tax=Bacillus canaveralius TaxID=1403243 RepID=A0A2N5GK58_9BACI|nr:MULTISPECIES: carbohydrate ABC transporter permease [Bacillus]PLR81653.1 carbohydrate ABC transporter permease [Bacillus canaveralius]PLR87719.1 carbohydrate ABC transporter permease [Bacillus sp. V33-4]PLR89883.1 carbohydrate ABC transporter permease [Bacillus canaveralius]RSK55164.1 carbohydrate ABC transporter permease [Bacillus canaveralius]